MSRRSWSASGGKVDKHAATGLSMNVLQIPVDYQPNYRNMPAQTKNDMTFIFSDSD
jgi:hypothetical protein